MASKQNPIIELLSFVGFLIVFIFGIGIKLMDDGLSKLFDLIDNHNLRGN